MKSAQDIRGLASSLARHGYYDPINTDLLDSIERLVDEVDGPDEIMKRLSRNMFRFASIVEKPGHGDVERYRGATMEAIRADLAALRRIADRRASATAAADAAD